MNIITFLSYAFLTSITPGPNNIMSMSTSSKYGLSHGLRFCLGVLFGFLGVMILCAVFTSILFDYIPKVEIFMRYAGAIYILYLAWTVYRNKQHEEKNGSKSNGVVQGMILQFINVKVILYGVSIFSTFILPFYRSFNSLIIFVIIISLIGFLCSCVWALFGSVFQKILFKNQKILNIVMALLLVYCAFSIILS